MSITKRRVKGKTQYRYVISYKDASGNYKQKASKWFDTAAQAKKAEAEYRSSHLQETAQNALTLAQALESYIEYKEPRVSTEYLKETVRLVKIYYSDLLEKPINQIQSKDILEAHKGARFQRKATSTKNSILAKLKVVLSYCDKVLEIPCNALKSVERFTPTSEERLKEFNVLRPEQFNLLLQNVKNSRYRAALYVLFWTGMRQNECLSLTFEDIHETYIDLRRQYDRSTHKWKPLKTKKARRVSINSELYAVFQTLKAEFMNEFPDEFEESWFCFGGARPLSKGHLKKVKNKAIEKTGLPYVRIHDLRHSHASYLIEQGVNIYKISKRLGHASIQMTLDRYGHLIDTEGDEILGALHNGAAF